MGPVTAPPLVWRNGATPSAWWSPRNGAPSPWPGTGNLRTIADPLQLAELLEAFYDEITPPVKSRPWAGFFQKNNREKALSFVVAAVLWIVVGYGSQVVQRDFDVPVGFSALPGTLTVTGVDPARVRVSLSGHRRAFAFLRQEDVKLELNLWDIRKGRHPMAITTRALSYPPGLEIEDIEPRRVEVRIEDKRGTPNHQPQTGIGRSSRRRG